MLIVGIDPGAKGALCILDWEKRTHQICDLPGKGQWKAFWLDIRTLMHPKPLIVGIEKVSSVPQTSAGSNFNFGWNVGAINTLIELTGFPFDHIPPKQWQSKVGISVSNKLKGKARKKAIKEAVALKCNQLYPNPDIYGPKGGLLDGRSDALMIAHAMGLKYYGG